MVAPTPATSETPAVVATAPAKETKTKVTSKFLKKKVDGARVLASRVREFELNGHKIVEFTCEDGCSYRITKEEYKKL